MTSGAVPVLLRVSVCVVLLVVMAWLPKARAVADRLAVVSGAVVVVPVRATVCGLPVTLSAMLRIADLGPGAWLAVGLNCTPIVQLDPAAIVPPMTQVPAPAGRANWYWLVPLKVKPPELMTSGTVPVLVRVSICVALVVVMAWLPKARLVADRLAVVVCAAAIRGSSSRRAANRRAAMRWARRAMSVMSVLPSLRHDGDRQVAQVQVLLQHHAAHRRLGDQVPGQVVMEHGVAARVGLADAPSQGIDMVGGLHPAGGGQGEAAAHVVEGQREAGVGREAAVGVEGLRHAIDAGQPVAGRCIGEGRGRRAAAGQPVAERIVAVAVARRGQGGTAEASQGIVRDEAQA